MNKRGFTLVEIMIVVLIIGLLAAIAIPNFLKARTETQKNACIDNMRQLEGAVEQAKMAGTASPGASDIIGDTLYIKVMPRCPTSKSTYSSIDPPACPGSEDGHVMPT